MSLEQLKDQAAQLQSKERRELIAYLVALQTRNDEEFQSTLARKVNDADSSHWAELADLQKRYSD